MIEAWQNVEFVQGEAGEVYGLFKEWLREEAGVVE